MAKTIKKSEYYNGRPATNNILEQGMHSFDKWTGNIKLIPLKDGTYALGLNVGFVNQNDAFCSETFRIRMDEETDCPYVFVREGEHDFNAENCALDIEIFRYMDFQTGVNHTVLNALYIYDPEDKRKMGGVFKFTGSCLEEKKEKYFPNHLYYEFGYKYGSRTDLSSDAIALILEFIENPENKEVLDNRYKRLPVEALEQMGEVIEEKSAHAGMHGGENRELNRLFDAMDLILNGGGLKGGLIELNLDELANEKAQRGE